MPQQTLEHPALSWPRPSPLSPSLSYIDLNHRTYWPITWHINQKKIKLKLFWLWGYFLQNVLWHLLWDMSCFIYFIEYYAVTKCLCVCFQGIIQKIVDIHKVRCVSCFGLRLSHLRTGEVHWLHPDMGVSHVRERYEHSHPQDDWRWVPVLMLIS